MANEVQFRGPGSSATCYFTIRNLTSGFVWNTSGGTGTYEAFVSGMATVYGINATEQGVSNLFAGNVPAAVPAGTLSITASQRAGGGNVDTDPVVAAGNVEWHGAGVRMLSDLATSGQLGQAIPIKLARGVQVLNFPLYLKSAADHITPFTSGVVSGQISRDGGSFGALQSGAFTEIGLGHYNLQALTSGDLNANTVRLHFTSVGISGGSADPVAMAFVLQRVSGYQAT